MWICNKLKMNDEKSEKFSMQKHNQKLLAPIKRPSLYTMYINKLTIKKLLDIENVHLNCLANIYLTIHPSFKPLMHKLESVLKSRQY